MQYLNKDGLTYFWNKAKQAFAASSHEHSQYRTLTDTNFNSDVRVSNGGCIFVNGGGTVYCGGYQVLTEKNFNEIIGNAEGGSY